MEETIVMEELLDNEILGKEFVDEYNLVVCEKIAKKLMRQFIKLKNIYPQEPQLRITQRYEPIYSCPLPRQNNSMERIDKHIDDQSDYQFMNQKISSMMQLMNSEEKACFTEMFIHGKNENQVAKRVGRSRHGIEPIIKSIIVRIVLTFHYEVMKNETFEFDESQKLELKYY